MKRLNSLLAVALLWLFTSCLVSASWAETFTASFPEGCIGCRESIEQAKEVINSIRLPAGTITLTIDTTVTNFQNCGYIGGCSLAFGFSHLDDPENWAAGIERAMDGSGKVIEHTGSPANCPDGSTYREHIVVELSLKNPINFKIVMGPTIEYHGGGPRWQFAQTKSIDISYTSGSGASSQGVSGTDKNISSGGTGTGTIGTGGGITVGPSDDSDCEQAKVAAMTLLAGKRQVKAGETVTLPVCLIKGAGVADMNFNVVYSSAVAQATNAVRGSLIPGNTLFEANPGEKGTARMGFAGNKDFGGTGPVALLTFKAVGKPGDRTPLRVVVPIIGSASGGKPAIATIDGEIKIVGDTTPPTPPTSPPSQPKGDCDGNGSLNVGDALCALQMSVGLIQVNLQTDMDNDGKVTSTDARLILQKVAGK